MPTQNKTLLHSLHKSYLSLIFLKKWFCYNALIACGGMELIKPKSDIRQQMNEIPCSLRLKISQFCVESLTTKGTMWESGRDGQFFAAAHRR